MPITTTIDAPEKTPKSGKRARKSANPQKTVPARSKGKHRPAAPTTKTGQVIGLLQRAKGAILYPIAGLRDVELRIKYR